MLSTQDSQNQEQAPVNSDNQMEEIIPHQPPTPKSAHLFAQFMRLVHAVVLIVIVAYTASGLLKPLEPSLLGILTALLSLFMVLDAKTHRA